MILFLVLTTLNLLCMLKNSVQFFTIILTLVVYIPVLQIYRTNKLSVNESFKTLSLDEEADFLTPKSLSIMYLVHFYAILTVFFFLVIMISRNVKYTQSKLSKLLRI